MWEACTNIPALNFQSVGSTRAKALRINFLALAAPCDTTIITSGKNELFHDVLLLHQQKKKRLFSSIFCQGWSFSSFLCIWRVPRRHMGGLWWYCVRNQSWGWRSTKTSLMSSWGHWDGEEPSLYYRRIWDLLRCLSLQYSESFLLSCFQRPRLDLL